MKHSEVENEHFRSFGINIYRRLLSLLKEITIFQLSFIYPLFYPKMVLIIYAMILAINFKSSMVIRLFNFCLFLSLCSISVEDVASPQQIKVVPSLQKYYCFKPIPKWTKQIKRIGQRKVKIRTKHGFYMLVDGKDEVVSKKLIQFGTWQKQYINLIGHIIKSGDNVLNLGSQSGFQAIIMGKVIGKTGKLYIFQPYSFSYELVKENIQINDLQKTTTIYQVGASDQNTKGVIYVKYQNTGGAEIKPKNKKVYRYNEKQTVQLDRVDQILPEDVKLNFALIDVEMMEVKALRGMQAVIDRSPDLVMMVEWQYGTVRNKLRDEKQAKQVIDFLQQKGYKIYKYRPNPAYYKCNIGKFDEIKTFQELAKIKFRDLFFFPPTVGLP